MLHRRRTDDASRLYFFVRTFMKLLPVSALLMLAAGYAQAGPPYVTDDPEPVDFRHWEVYLSSIYQHTAGGSFGTLPHIEVNNGVAPNLQLHLITPAAFSATPGGPMLYGSGDTELGAKFRFVQESKTRPMVGIFPLLEAPTGNAGRGLGTGHLQTFLPVWVQKSWGAWTSYGGAGYWINPGAGNRNYWLFGGLLQKDLNKHWTLGVELFDTTSSAVGVGNQFNFNIGGQYNFDDGHHLLFSVGRSISGQTNMMSYVGYQWTFGPRARAAREGPAAKPQG